MSTSISTLTLAVLQTSVVKEKQRNIENACSQLQKAASMGAQMAVLPEMFSCPYHTANFPVYAEPEGGESWQAMSNAAKENGIYLAAGTMPECEKGHYYNTAYIFNPQGELIGKHRKVHLFDIHVEGGQHFQESETLSAGNQVTVFDTDFGKMGAAICYDLRFPELARLMALQGAKIFIVPAAFNMTTGPLHWELLFRSRATDNQVFTVGVAPARDIHGDYVSYGNSIVVSPWGKVLARMDEKPGIRLIDLDLKEIDEVRAQLPLLAHRRTDLYELRQI